MLILTRRENESITVGDVTFKIVRIRGGNVRIGVEAPKDVRIVRTELEEHDGRDRADDVSEG